MKSNIKVVEITDMEEETSELRDYLIAVSAIRDEVSSDLRGKGVDPDVGAKEMMSSVMRHVLSGPNPGEFVEFMDKVTTKISAMHRFDRKIDSICESITKKHGIPVPKGAFFRPSIVNGNVAIAVAIKKENAECDCDCEDCSDHQHEDVDANNGCENVEVDQESHIRLVEGGIDPSIARIIAQKMSSTTEN